MAIQIRGNQIKNETVEAAKINLSGSFDFRAASSFIASTKAEADNSTAVATTAYVHTIVSGSVIDGFQGGDGIAIDTSTSPDTIAVDLAANKGLEFSSGELQIKLDGSSLALGSNGISLADGGVANAKLADSAVNNAKIASDAAIAISKLAARTISGKDLGTNLDSLSAGNGLSMTSYNGSTAVSDLTIDLDGSTLTVGADGIKISTNGVGGNEIAAGGVATANLADNAVSTAKIGNLQVSTAKLADTSVSTGKIADSAVATAKIADGAVSTAKIANDAVDASKLGVSSTVDSLTANGSTTVFDLSSTIDDAFAQILVFRNGVCVEQVESSPSGVDQFSLSLDGGTGGVAAITFGSAPSTGDDLRAFYIA